MPQASSVTPVVGRDPELARLSGVLERARAGDARAVLVGGDAGVGKTRLLDEIAERAGDAGMTVVTGHWGHRARFRRVAEPPGARLILRVVAAYATVVARPSTLCGGGLDGRAVAPARVEEEAAGHADAPDAAVTGPGLPEGGQRPDVSRSRPGEHVDHGERGRPFRARSWRRETLRARMPV
ncbi:ATP-binding protein [Streptomyces sp. NPDC003007]